jgi:hypothetical protein
MKAELQKQGTKDTRSKEQVAKDRAMEVKAKVATEDMPKTGQRQSSP